MADLAIEHDLVVVTDEVYEHLVFDGSEHIAMATLPGMRERTLTISSGGKTFNTTGWKIGWLCGPAALVQAARTAKQFLTYVSGGPFQPAIALGLGLPDAFYAGLAADLQAKRDRLLPGLVDAGFNVYPHQRHLLRHGRHPSAAARRRRHGVLPCAAAPLRRGRHPQRGALRRTSTRAGTSCGSRSASASTCSTRPSRRLKDSSR